MIFESMMSLRSSLQGNFYTCSKGDLIAGRKLIQIATIVFHVLYNGFDRVSGDNYKVIGCAEKC